jgi:hypothetical protein
VEICRTLKGIDMDIRKVPGVQLANDRTGEIIYTPPEGESHLRELLSNWGAFCITKQTLTPWYAWQSHTISSKPFTRSRTGMAAPDERSIFSS